MQKKLFEYLISFLLGFSWAIALLGAFFAFETFLPLGFITAFISAIFGSLFGIFLLIFLTNVNLNIKRTEEVAKQSEILNRISNQLDSINEKLPNNR